MIEKKYRNSYLPKEFVELVSRESPRLKYKYRSLPINRYRIDETTDKVIITFPHFINEKEVDFNGMKECWIDRSLFATAVVDSNATKYFRDKRIGNDWLFRILKMPTFRGVFLQGFGMQNGKYLNLSKHDSFKIHASEYFFKYVEELRENRRHN